MNIPNPEVDQNPGARRMFVTMCLLGKKKEKLDLLGKKMVYWTSLDKEDVLDLLEEKVDIVYLLGKMMIYWTPLGKNKRYLVSLGKRMIYLTSLEKWGYTGPIGRKTRDTWSSWGKG